LDIREEYLELIEENDGFIPAYLESDIIKYKRSEMMAMSALRAKAKEVVLLVGLGHMEQISGILSLLFGGEAVSAKELNSLSLPAPGSEILDDGGNIQQLDCLRNEIKSAKDNIKRLYEEAGLLEAERTRF